MAKSSPVDDSPIASETVPLLTFAGVSKRFPDGTTALDGVDLRVSAGEFVSVIGPSGCGKSTLLRIASDLTKASDGAVDMQTRKVGYVFQDPTLLPWRSVQANVELFAELRGLPKAERRRRADAALAERFGVSSRTIQRDIRALQERGARRAANRRRRSHRTRAHYAAIYRRFLTWLDDELGQPPTRDDLSGEVLARWIALRASGGGHGGGGLSSASLRLECGALRRLVRQAGYPELAASLSTSRRQAPRQRPSHLPSTSVCWLSPTSRRRSAPVTGPPSGCWVTLGYVPSEVCVDVRGYRLEC